MWTLAFWKALTERAVSTAAQAAILALGAGQLNVLDADWGTVLGFAAGGAVLSALKSLGVNAATRTGPSVTDAEVLPRAAPFVIVADKPKPSPTGYGSGV